MTNRNEWSRNMSLNGKHNHEFREEAAVCHMLIGFLENALW